MMQYPSRLYRDVEISAGKKAMIPFLSTSLLRHKEYVFR